MTTQPDLEALDALHAAGTAGEWSVDPGTENLCVEIAADTSAYVCSFQYESYLEESERHRGEADAALIVALHNAWPTVAAELRRARKIEAAARLVRACIAHFREHLDGCQCLHWNGGPCNCGLPELRAALDAPDESGGR